jgi:hypothetical protein
MAELLGWAIGFGIVALLMLAGVVPIYFILKKISGSKTTFAEDVQEAYTAARPQPRPLGGAKVLSRTPWFVFTKAPRIDVGELWLRFCELTIFGLNVFANWIGPRLYNSLLR